MPSTTVNAKGKEKSVKIEREDNHILLSIGVFFDDSHSRSKAAKLSSLYGMGYKKDTERAYSIAKSISSPDFMYIWKDGNLIIEYKNRFDLLCEAAEAVNATLYSIVNLIYGYSGYDDIEIKIDIYGIDNGVIPSYLLAYIVEPSNDGFDGDDKQILMSQLDSAVVEIFRTLRWKKYVNHLEILNTIFSQKDEEAALTPISDDNSENDGYQFSLGVSENRNLSDGSELIKRGFSKEDVEKTLDDFQTQLDMLGMVDVYGVGSVADALNVIISLGRGQWGNAAMSLMAIIPVVGNYATSIKLARRATPTAKIVTKAADGSMHSAKSTSKAADNITDLNKFKETKRLSDGSDLADNVADFTKYREAKELDKKIIWIEQTEVRTGTGTVYNSLDHIGGSGNINRYTHGSSFSSSYYGNTGKTTRQSSDISIFDSKNAHDADKIVPINGTDKIREFNPIGAEQQGTQRAVEHVKRVVFDWLNNVLGKGQ